MWFGLLALFQLSGSFWEFEGAESSSPLLWENLSISVLASLMLVRGSEQLPDRSQPPGQL